MTLWGWNRQNTQIVELMLINAAVSLAIWFDFWMWSKCLNICGKYTAKSQGNSPENTTILSEPWKDWQQNQQLSDPPREALNHHSGKHWKQWNEVTGKPAQWTNSAGFSWLVHHRRKSLSLTRNLSQEIFWHVTVWLMIAVFYSITAAWYCACRGRY